MFGTPVETPLQLIKDKLLDKAGIRLFLKREDLTDPVISGNKYRKLKYNLMHARKAGHTKLLTFGGAYSNHIHAVAYAGKKFNFKTIGIIRGEPAFPLNPTLQDAARYGMDFKHISRKQYRDKYKEDFLLELKKKYGSFYLVPEGGSNSLAVKGCTEILKNEHVTYEHVCCACGTGGTLAGIIAGLDGRKKIWGFPALKGGDFLIQDVSSLITGYNDKHYTNWHIISDYHFGGYAKFQPGLINFINRFKKMHQIPLDPIYTGKMLFGVYDLINKGFFNPGETIIAIHTGGLQGIRGFNDRFGHLIE